MARQYELNSAPERLPAAEAGVEDWEIVLGVVINGEPAAYPTRSRCPGPTRISS